jgi:hypothetical protein
MRLCLRSGGDESSNLSAKGARSRAGAFEPNGYRNNAQADDRRAHPSKETEASKSQILPRVARAAPLGRQRAVGGNRCYLNLRRIGAQHQSSRPRASPRRASLRGLHSSSRDTSEGVARCSHAFRTALVPLAPPAGGNPAQDARGSSGRVRGRRDRYRRVATSTSRPSIRT